MKSFRSLLTLLGAMAVTSAALATAVVAVIGYVPETGVQGFPGLVVSGGTNSVVTGNSGCGTITATAGGVMGGTFTLGTFTTTCTITVTLAAGYAAPNGLFCQFIDVTNPGDQPKQKSTSTTTACVTAANTSLNTGDVITYYIAAF